MAALPTNRLPWMFGGAFPSQQEEQMVGLLGKPNKLQGLLGDPIFNAGLAMLGNQGPHLSDALAAGGRGLQQGLQYQQDYARQRQLDELNKRNVESQITARDKGNLGPSNIQEWRYYNSLSPDDQKRYLEMKRAEQFKVQDIGGAPVAVQSRGGNIVTQPLSTPEIEREAAAALEGAKVSGKMTGEAKTQAQLDLPQEVAQAEEAVRLVDEMLAHPGFSAAVGAPNPFQGGFGNMGTLPGTPARGFKAYLDQLKGKQFLQAYQSLKGGGQITEVEGTKAEQALARMDAAQSEKDFIKGARDFQEVIRAGVERAKRKAGAPVEEKPAEDNVVNWDDL